MHRYLRYVVSLIVMSVWAIAWVSAGQAQYLECKTVATAPDSLFVKNMAPPYSYENLVAEVRCVVHVLREDGGSGGLSASDVDSMLGVARQDLSSLGVTLVIADQLNISNSTYYADPDSFIAEIFTDNFHEDAIDIYLGPAEGDAFGLAQGIPSSALLLTGNLDSSSALSHLLGHCLGLYDTEETVFGVEAPDGNNGATAGDLIADTAADPGLEGWVEADCALAAAFVDSFPGYDPDPTNIMSNSRMSCWLSFTESQRARVMSELQTSAIFHEIAVVETAVYLNVTGESHLRLNAPNLPAVPSSAASFDFDGDGKKDIFVAGHENISESADRGYAGRCSGFTANGVPIFVDQTSNVFSSSRPPNGTQGCLAADYDNDGHIDFYAPNPEFMFTGGNQGDTHRLFRNNGDGSFQNVTSELGDVATITGAWGDYDGDGYLDLLSGVAPPNVTPNSSWYAVSWILYHGVPKSGAPGGRGFEPVTSTIAPDLATNDEVRTALWADLDRDHDVDLVTIQSRDTHSSPQLPLSSRYFRNDAGILTDVTSSQFPDVQIFDTGSFSAALGDVDNDGIVDIVYHGQNDKGWLRNSIDTTTRLSSLQVAWNQNQNDPGATCWPIEPMDLDVMDYDLDGWLDMVAPSYSSTQAHVLLRNRPADHHFTCTTSSGLHARQSFGIGAVDFDMDGYTELFKACLASTDRLLYRSYVAYQGSGSSHWVGIRLEDTDNSCNFRGIGATVIVTAGGHRQAQVVDGGSGRSGQHDLDLSFGLGAYSDSVDVEVIWPCGQTQYARVTADAYHTISMTKPIVDDNTVIMYLNFVLGEETLDWIFEWKTAMPGDNTLDWVEFPNGIPGYPGITHLDASMQDVDVTVTAAFSGGTTVYTHRVTWSDRPCADELTVYYKVHSKALNADDSSVRKSLHLYGCPQS